MTDTTDTPTLVGKTLHLRASAGPLSAGTPVVVLEDMGDMLTVQTLSPMPNVRGFDMLNDKPIIHGIRRDWLVERRPRSGVVGLP